MDWFESDLWNFSNWLKIQISMVTQSLKLRSVIGCQNSKAPGNRTESLRGFPSVLLFEKCMFDSVKLTADKFWMQLEKTLRTFSTDKGRKQDPKIKKKPGQIDFDWRFSLDGTYSTWLEEIFLRELGLSPTRVILGKIQRKNDRYGRSDDHKGSGSKSRIRRWSAHSRLLPSHQSAALDANPKSMVNNRTSFRWTRSLSGAGERYPKQSIQEDYADWKNPSAWVDQVTSMPWRAKNWFSLSEKPISGWWYQFPRISGCGIASIATGQLPNPRAPDDRWPKKLTLRIMLKKLLTAYEWIAEGNEIHSEALQKTFDRSEIPFLAPKKK